METWRRAALLQGRAALCSQASCGPGRGPGSPLCWAGPVLACSSSLRWAHHGDPGLCQAAASAGLWVRVCAPCLGVRAGLLLAHSEPPPGLGTPVGGSKTSPPPHGHGAWRHLPASACPPPAGGEGTRTVVGSVTQGQRTDGGGGGERARWGRAGISGWSGPRAVCWQRLLAGPRSGWGSVPPPPTSWLQGKAVASGPCQGQACARHRPDGCSPGRWSRLSLQASLELGPGR